VNYSLRGVDIEPRTVEWPKRPSPKSLPARAGTSGWTEGRVLARSDRSGPIELLAARYPVIRRLVGEANSGDGMIERWVAEAAIVARPLLEVEVRRLPSGGYAFLHALHGGNGRRDRNRSHPQIRCGLQP